MDWDDPIIKVQRFKAEHMIGQNSIIGYHTLSTPVPSVHPNENEIELASAKLEEMKHLLGDKYDLRCEGIAQREASKIPYFFRTYNLYA